MNVGGWQAHCNVASASVVFSSIFPEMVYSAAPIHFGRAVFLAPVALQLCTNAGVPDLP